MTRDRLRVGWAMRLEFSDHVETNDDDSPSELAVCAVYGEVLEVRRHLVVISPWCSGESDPHPDARSGQTRFVIARSTILRAQRLAPVEPTPPPRTDPTGRPS